MAVPQFNYFEHHSNSNDNTVFIFYDFLKISRIHIHITVAFSYVDFIASLQILYGQNAATNQENLHKPSDEYDKDKDWVH